MGAGLTPIVPIRRVSLRHLVGKVVAVDALNAIYQFLALIRKPDGEPLKDGYGRITSHMLGIAYRYTKLMSEYLIKPVFVYDGMPHPLKAEELKRRRAVREKAYAEWRSAVTRGEYDKAFSKAVVALFLESYMVEDSKRLLSLMGIPWIDAPGDAEAQAAYIVQRGDAWCVATIDYDSLLYGSPRMLRYLTLTGFEWLPSKRVARPLVPEVIELERVLKKMGITREQLVDIAILVGTDYNPGVAGVGPKTALRLIKNYGSIERLPRDIRGKVVSYYDEVRSIFLSPAIKKGYRIEFSEPKIDELYRFLVYERGFSPARVNTIVERLSKINWKLMQDTLERWLGDAWRSPL